ncbi:MAG: hypothetical protein RIC89_15495 [Pseudomonadales bacterium]
MDTKARPIAAGSVGLVSAMAEALSRQGMKTHGQDASLDKRGE